MPARVAEVEDDALVAGEEVPDPLRGGRVHAEAVAGEVDEGRKGAVDREMDPVVVARGEVDGGRGAAREGGGRVLVPAEERLERVGEGLCLDEGRARDLARALHGPVRRRCDRVGLGGERPRVRAELPGEEGVEGRPGARVGLDRVGEVHLVAPHDGADEPLLPCGDADPRRMEHDPGQEAARIRALERDGEGGAHGSPGVVGPARRAAGGARSAAARSSRLSRLCTGRNSSTWGRRARIPAAFGAKPS